MIQFPSKPLRLAVVAVLTGAILLGCLIYYFLFHDSSSRSNWAMDTVFRLKAINWAIKDFEEENGRPPKGFEEISDRFDYEIAKHRLPSAGEMGSFTWHKNLTRGETHYIPLITTGYHEFEGEIVHIVLFSDGEVEVFRATK